MAISTRIRFATAKHTTLTTCLFAALAAGTAGTRHADALPDPHRADASLRSAAFGPFTAFAHRAPIFGAPRAHSSSITITVTTCADDGSAGSLRDAVENANDGDIIDLSQLTCSLITLQHGALASAVPSLTIQGPGIDALTIDAGSTDRVLTGNELAVSDMTLAHGTYFGNPGGGCVLAASNLTLTRARLSNCQTFVANDAAAGGGAVVLGDLSMTDSSIINSSATGLTNAAGGGAIVGGNLTMTGSTVSGNSVIAGSGNAYGGGIFALGTIVARGSHVTGNKAWTTDGIAYGGGIHSPYADIQILDWSVVSGNKAHSDSNTSYGGGINSGLANHPQVAATTLLNSTLTGNTAESSCATCVLRGGGIHAYDLVNIKYSTVDTNEAKCLDIASSCSADGGGVSAGGSQSSNALYINDSTISTNKAIAGTGAAAIGTGGGLSPQLGKPFVIRNSTIAFNSATSHGGGISATSPAISPAEMSSSLVADNQSVGGVDDIASMFGLTSTITGSNNLVTRWDVSTVMPADTLTADPHLGALTAQDGGLTSVHPIPSDSVAVDAGANTIPLACDQRGFPYRRVYGASTDIGAYEFQGEKHLFADTFEVLSYCPPAP